MDPFYRRRWFKVFTGLVILCLLFISFLPYAVRYGIEQWYLKQNVDSVSLEDVDINLFTGELQLKNLIVIKNSTEVINLSNAIIETDWLPFFGKRSDFPHMQINDVTASVNLLANGDIDIAGILLPLKQDKETAATPSPWEFGLHTFTINNALLHVKTPLQKADFTIEHITLNRLLSWSHEASQFNFTGKINAGTVTASGQLYLFADQPAFEGNINLKDLELEPATPYLKEHVQAFKGLLNLDTEFMVKHDPGKSTHIQTKTTMSLNNLLAKADNNEVSLDKFKWQGKATFQLSRDNPLPDYLVLGKIDSENVALILDKQHRYHHDKLHWDGTIKSAGNGMDQPEVKGSINVSNITLQHLINQQELFHTGSMSIQELDTSNIDKLVSQQITLQDMRLLFKPVASREKQKPALIQAKALSIKDASFNDGKHVHLGNTHLTDALIYIHKQKDGQLQQIATLKSGMEKDNKTADNADKGKEPAQQIQVSISQFDIRGKSKIHVIDESVTPTFKTELQLKKANIRNIDSRKPGSPSPYVVDANLDKYSSIHFDGDAYPFSSPLSLKLNGKIVNISLPPVSSYTASLIGYDLTSGQLNADLDMNIDKGKIDAKSKMKLSNLEVKASDAKKSEELSSQLSMPLDSALSLLRDKNNDIELNIPVKGDINKPDFDISGIINKAIGSAMKTASMTYLTHALQPYGSLITLAKLAKAAADHVSLNPITFAPASSQMDDNALAYSAKIAGLMKERPKLRIKLCSKATPADAQQLAQQQIDAWKSKQKQTGVEASSKASPPVFTIADEQLLELAATRADIIKNMLVNDHKIDAARLFLCKPVIDQEKDGKPRVDMTI